MLVSAQKKIQKDTLYITNIYYIEGLRYYFKGFSVVFALLQKACYLCNYKNLA